MQFEHLPVADVVLGPYNLRLPGYKVLPAYHSAISLWALLSHSSLAHGNTCLFCRKEI